MSRRSPVVPTMMTLLSLVVLAQAALLFWFITQPREADAVVSALRRTPVVGEVVEFCLPAEG